MFVASGAAQAAITATTTSAYKAKSEFAKDVVKQGGNPYGVLHNTLSGIATVGDNTTSANDFTSKGKTYTITQDSQTSSFAKNYQVFPHGGQNYTLSSLKNVGKQTGQMLGGGIYGLNFGANHFPNGVRAVGTDFVTYVAPSSASGAVLGSYFTNANANFLPFPNSTWTNFVSTADRDVVGTVDQEANDWSDNPYAEHYTGGNLRLVEEKSDASFAQVGINVLRLTDGGANLDGGVGGRIFVWDGTQQAYLPDEKVESLKATHLQPARVDIMVDTPVAQQQSLVDQTSGRTFFSPERADLSTTHNMMAMSVVNQSMTDDDAQANPAAQAVVGLANVPQLGTGKAGIASYADGVMGLTGHAQNHAAVQATQRLSAAGVGVKKGGFWLKPFGGWNKVQNATGVATGILAGVHGHVSRQVQVGMTAGWQYGKINLDQHYGTQVSNHVTFGPYIKVRKNNGLHGPEFDNITLFSFGTNKNTRGFSTSGDTNNVVTVEGKPSEWKLHNMTGLRYLFLAAPNTYVGPFARFHVLHRSQKAYTETETGSYNLVVPKLTSTVLREEAGFQMHYIMPQNRSIYLSGALVVQQGLNATKTDDFSFEVEPTNFGLTTRGKANRMLGRTELGLSQTLPTGWTMSLAGVGEFGNKYLNLGGMLQIRKGF